MSVVVADDHDGYREAIVRGLGQSDEVEVIGAVAGGAEALARILRTSPAVALLDVHMRDLGGLDVLEALRRARARTRVILLSGETDLRTARKAVAAGARGYLSKLALPDQIRAGVLAVASGGTAFAEELADDLNA